ncbi:hypothetical protein [Thauera phenolivorans]|uniref:hypothetical protein n=1 Tax=Thauera phenolivorans TaxID=1792543 RepID=UPI001E2D51DA|nr:hypothetical protein [Thauera phenolivorans]
MLVAIAAPSMPSAPEDGVDHEQQQDHRVAAEHPLGVAVAVFDRPGIGAHQP